MANNREHTEWKKHFEVLDKEKDNWTLRCGFCKHEFRGRGYRANCHLAGTPGKGVQICTMIPPQVREEFICAISNNTIVPISLGVQDSEGAAATQTIKRQQQSSMSMFVRKAAVDKHTLQQFSLNTLTTLVAPRALLVYVLTMNQKCALCGKSWKNPTMVFFVFHVAVTWEICW